MHSRIFPKNLLPKPSPLLAPLTSPAISTISTVAGTNFSGFTIDSKVFNLKSGTFTVPRLGSIVQKGKLAAWALALLKQLKSVDFPTLGSPTIPHFILFYFSQMYSSIDLTFVK